MSLSDELLRGAIDLHQHAAPSLFERITDDLGLATEARLRGMRGVLIKAHEQDTTGRAFLVRKQVPGVEVFGGLVLNWMVGGLNPSAVEAAIKLGARMVWMPTLSAQHHVNFFGGSHFGRSAVAKAQLRVTRPGITILNDHGELTAETQEILGLIAEADICLSTGHLSLREIVPLVRAAKKAGVKKLLVTHPDLKLSGLSIADQKALAAEGAFLEKDLITMMPAWQSISPEAMVESIRQIGPAHCVLGTDFGQLHHPSPAEGLRIFIQMLLERGITADEIHTMVAVNPARLLGLA